MYFGVDLIRNYQAKIAALVVVIALSVVSLCSFISPVYAGEIVTQPDLAAAGSNTGKLNPCPIDKTSTSLGQTSGAIAPEDRSTSRTSLQLAQLLPGCYPAGTQCRVFIQNEVSCCSGSPVVGKQIGWCIGWYEALPCK
jgi:hypothetical protein